MAVSKRLSQAEPTPLERDLIELLREECFAITGQYPTPSPDYRGKLISPSDNDPIGEGLWAAKITHREASYNIALLENAFEANSLIVRINREECALRGDPAHQPLKNKTREQVLVFLKQTLQ